MKDTDAETHIQGEFMSIARVTEIIASSSKSFDDAVRQGIKRTNKTIDNITGTWVEDMKVVIVNGEVSEYRVALKLSFILKD